MIKPPALKKGDTIGVFAPSSFVEKKNVLKAKKYLEDKGFNVYLHPQYEEKYNQSAGTTEAKVNALHELFGNDEINAIIAAGGGNRALHMLEHIDYDLIRDNPKIFMGFSDVTALLSSFSARTNLTTFHGPVFTWLPAMDDHWDFNLAVLSGKTPAYPMTQCRILREGAAEGPLTGGNLSLFHYLAGTKDALPPDGAILFLEDLREEINKVDRMLLHLRRTGYLSRLSGLVCGSFSNLGDNGRPYGFSLEDLLLEHCKGYDFPIVMDGPFGHENQLYALPVGGIVRMEAQNGRVSLFLNEPAVAT